MFIDWLPAAIRQSSTLHKLEAGEALFRQGDKAPAVFEVEEGQLRLIRHTISSRDVLHTARSRELFTEAALFADRYHCDAVATAASRVRAYPKRKLLAAFRKDPHQFLHEPRLLGLLPMTGETSGLEGECVASALASRIAETSRSLSSERSAPLAEPPQHASYVCPDMSPTPESA